MKLSILGVGLLGPGLKDWAGGHSLLREPARWTPSATVVPAPERLPANERRRAGAVIKASIAVADQALAGTHLDAATLATVFTSSTGDPANCHALCEALAAPQRMVSPTRFTNSVHNAPAGFWHIAVQSRAPSTSLAAYDASFGAGLLEAAAQCLSTDAPVLLVTCDVPYPHPLHALRPLPDVFAVALIVAPGGGRELDLQLIPEAPGSRCATAGLDALRSTIPAARALPLLQALAGDGAARLVLEGQSGFALQLELAAR